MFLSEQCNAPDLAIVKEQSACCLYVVMQKLEKDLYTTLVRFLYSLYRINPIQMFLPFVVKPSDKKVIFLSNYSLICRFRKHFMRMW